MSKKKDLEIILNNQEVEPNNPYDFSMRKTPNSVIPRFRGLAGQITVNPDDMYRPYVWLNKDLGEHHEVVLADDFKTPKYEYKSVNISRLVHEVTIDQNITVDSSVAGVWKIKYTSNVSLTLKLDNTPSEVTVILQSANPFARVTFVGEGLSWIGSAPNIKGDSGTLFAFHFYKTTLGIVGEESRDIPHQSTATITPVLQAYTSLGYGLPAGTSEVGATGQKYELLSGIADYSADDLYNIGKVASSINHVEKVSGLEKYLPVVVANATSITTLAAVAKLLADNLEVYKTDANNLEIYKIAANNLEIYKTVAHNLEVFKTVANNLAGILNVNTNLPTITSVKDKLADISAVKSKLTEIETVNNSLNSINTLAPLATTLQAIVDNMEKIQKVYDDIIAKENTETEGA